MTSEFLDFHDRRSYRAVAGKMKHAKGKTTAMRDSERAFSIPLIWILSANMNRRLAGKMLFLFVYCMNIMLN